MRTTLALAALAAAALSQAQAGGAPRVQEPSAFTVVSKALAEAAATDKNVWVLFHASW
jgi:hypothetical protein